MLVTNKPPFPLANCLQRRYTFANYVPGVQYTFRAAAHNKAGWSTASVGRGLKAPVAGM